MREGWNGFGLLNNERGTRIIQHHQHHRCHHHHRCLHRRHRYRHHRPPLHRRRPPPPPLARYEDALARESRERTERLRHLEIGDRVEVDALIAAMASAAHGPASDGASRPMAGGHDAAGGAPDYCGGADGGGSGGGGLLGDAHDLLGALLDGDGLLDHPR